MGDKKSSNVSRYTPDQKHEIEAGLKSGVNVRLYGNPAFLAIQMHQIRRGLEEKLPVECYALPEYDWFQMEEIRKGLKSGIDIAKYARPGIPFDVMRQIREGLENGIDLSMGIGYSAGVLKQLRIASCEGIDIIKYIKQGYEEEQLKEIRIALEKKIDIDPYLHLLQRGAFIREIVLGLEKELDVSAYANEQLSWQQMREIRLGLENRVDVRVYQNPLYSAQQMHEIRLGLQENLPVDRYSSFMYTAREMHKRRLKLEESRKNNLSGTTQKKKYRDFILMTNANKMEAMIIVPCKGTKVNADDVMAALQERGIVEGIEKDVIDFIAQDGAPTETVIVARGREPEAGKDGWYEFLFDTDIKSTPQLNENGSVDYKNVKWFEIVKQDQPIAVYHEAQTGKAGITVTGEPIPGLKGNEQPPIKGFGFKILPDRRTYIAGTDGKVELHNGRLEVTNILILDGINSANGNVSFNGSVYVKGTVGDGVRINASKDILVDGFTEAAVLEAGGDIILREGNNAGRGRHGYIKAGNDVMGKFFENATVIAGRDMKANYCLNSNVTVEGNVEIAGDIGTLAGGIIKAGDLVKSHDIGNAAGISTSIVVGRQEKYYYEKAVIDEKFRELENELKLLRNAYRDIKRRYTAEERNNNPLYLKVENAIYTKETELRDVRNLQDELKAEENKLKLARIVVKGTIYQGVKVSINGSSMNVKKTGNVTLRQRDGAVVVYRNI